MCGIVGFITTEQHIGKHARRKFIKQALMVDTVRGPHATGTFFVEHNHDIEKFAASAYYKSLDNGFDFVNRKEFDEFLNDIHNYRAIVGHNRFATMGARSNVDNAHPFLEGNVVLVHNGTLHGTHKLPKTMTQLGVEVDSHVIAHNLAEHTIDEVIPNLYGAFTLVWHDYRDNGIHVIRNDERPLHFTKLASQDTVVFASESLMLKMIVDRIKEKCGPVYYPKPGRLLSFYEDGGLTPTTRDIEVQDTDAWGDWGDSYYYNNRKPRNMERSKSGTTGTAAEKPRELYDYFSKHLGELGLERNSIYRYTPMVVVPAMTATGRKSDVFSRSTGKVHRGRGKKSHIAEIHNIYATDSFKKAAQQWSVKVLGVKSILTQSGAIRDIILCEVVDYDWAAYEEQCKQAEQEYEEELNRMGMLDTREPHEIIEEPYLKGPYGRCLTETEWLKLVKDGCTNCSQDIEMSDHDWVEWVGDGQQWPLCASCVDSDFAIEEAVIEEKANVSDEKLKNKTPTLQ